MKILFVIKALSLAGGGAERVLASIAAGLVARGHAVTIISFDPPGSTDFYYFPEAIARIRIGSGGHDRKTRWGDVVRLVTALRRTIEALGPDVAVGFMHSAYVPMAAALIGTRIRQFASEHIVYSHYADKPLQRRLLAAAIRRMEAVTAISPAMRDGFPAAIRLRMVVIPNPVPQPEGEAADPVGGARKVLLTVGRLAEQKAHDVLIAAFARLAGRYPDWSLEIVGEGNLRPMLEAQVRALGLGRRVFLPGATTDVTATYRAAQLFVLPSAYESFGLVTAEAMQAGLPSIGFADCEGTNELIVNEVNGLLVDPGENRVAALAAALDRAMGDPVLRERLAAAAPSMIARFSPDRIVDQWELLLAAETPR